MKNWNIYLIACFVCVIIVLVPLVMTFIGIESGGALQQGLSTALNGFDTFFTLAVFGAIIFGIMGLVKSKKEGENAPGFILWLVIALIVFVALYSALAIRQ